VCPALPPQHLIGLLTMIFQPLILWTSPLPWRIWVTRLNRRCCLRIPPRPNGPCLSPVYPVLVTRCLVRVVHRNWSVMKIVPFLVYTSPLTPRGLQPCRGLHALYAALECAAQNVPIFGDEALQSTRTHTACTNGVRTKDHDFWTSEFSMIPREKWLLFVYSQNDPNNP
jgi:hypothetical protein